LDTTHAEAVSLRAVAKLESGAIVDSLADFKKASDLQPKNPVRFENYGVALMANKQYSDAQSAYQSAIALDAKSVAAHLGLGGAYLEDRQFSKAESEFRTAMTLAPKSATPHDSLGLSLQAQKKFADAEDQFRQAIALHETADEWVNLGVAQLQQTKRAEAKTSIQRALTIDPQNDRAKDYLNWLAHHP
jgi:Tfp pilus assembly protein PilF